MSNQNSNRAGISDTEITIRSKLLNKIFPGDPEKAKRLFKKIFQEIYNEGSPSESELYDLVYYKLNSEIGRSRTRQILEPLQKYLLQLLEIVKSVNLEEHQEKPSEIDATSLFKVDQVLIEEPTEPKKEAISDKSTEPDKNYFLEEVLEGLISKSKMDIIEFQKRINEWSHEAENLDDVEIIRMGAGIVGYTLYNDNFKDAQNLLYKDLETD
ncbi:MAG: hypothetical protein ACFFBD_26330, partial [Candidatus Hodarchaeota archaeon]